MKLVARLLLTVFTFSLAGFAQADMSSTDYEKIQIMLEYNQRMVKNTEAYLRDRAKIPADYQDVADKEYLRKAKLEKPMTSLKPAKPETSAAVEEKPKMKVEPEAKKIEKPEKPAYKSTATLKK